MRSKMSFTKLLKMAIALLEILVSGWTYLISFQTFFRFFFSPSAGTAAFTVLSPCQFRGGLGSGGGWGFASSGCAPADENSTHTLSATRERKKFCLLPDAAPPHLSNNFVASAIARLMSRVLLPPPPGCDLLKYQQKKVRHWVWNKPQCGVQTCRTAVLPKEPALRLLTSP